MLENIAAYLVTSFRLRPENTHKPGRDILQFPQLNNTILPQLKRIIGAKIYSNFFQKQSRLLTGDHYRIGQILETCNFLNYVRI